MLNDRATFRILSIVFVSIGQTTAGTCIVVIGIVGTFTIGDIIRVVMDEIAVKVFTTVSCISAGAETVFYISTASTLGHFYNFNNIVVIIIEIILIGVTTIGAGIVDIHTILTGFTMQFIGGLVIVPGIECTGLIAANYVVVEVISVGSILVILTVVQGYSVICTDIAQTAAAGVVHAVPFDTIFINFGVILAGDILEIAVAVIIGAIVISTDTGEALYIAAAAILGHGDAIVRRLMIINGVLIEVTTGGTGSTDDNTFFAGGGTFSEDIVFHEIMRCFLVDLDKRNWFGIALGVSDDFISRTAVFFLCCITVDVFAQITGLTDIAGIGMRYAVNNFGMGIGCIGDPAAEAISRDGAFLATSATIFLNKTITGIEALFKINIFYFVGKVFPMLFGHGAVTVCAFEVKGDTIQTGFRIIESYIGNTIVVINPCEWLFQVQFLFIIFD